MLPSYIVFYDDPVKMNLVVRPKLGILNLVVRPNLGVLNLVVRPDLGVLNLVVRYIFCIFAQK